MRKWRLAGMALVVSTSLTMFAAAPGWAGSTGNGTAGSGFPQYTYHADAVKGCKGDTVVWGSSANKGVYYVDGAGPQRIGGFYACMSAVKKAGYKIVRAEVCRSVEMTAGLRNAIIVAEWPFSETTDANAFFAASCSGIGTGSIQQ